MPSNTAFGPQGLNATSTLPADHGKNSYGSGVHTWCQPCDATGKQGTVLDAQFFNTITGNLRRVVLDAVANGATIGVDDGAFDMLSLSIQHFAKVGAPVQTVGAGLAIDANGQINIDVPALKVMTA